VFFLGAGCSSSSGIPEGGTLVRRWLPRLKKLKTGDEHDWESWAKEVYPDYNEDRPSLLYGRVIEDLFLTPEERQREIERLTEGKDPGFGYSVLAQLMTHERYGRHCNVVLTVNFDDLIADALYLYTQKKPLVISHDSLVGFVRVTRTRPLVIKLHGDARLEPKNTGKETKELAASVQATLKALLSETGLVFVGYGGHDESIAEILDEIPASSLPWGIYWLGSRIPAGRIGDWLKRRNAIWVQHRGFDELMLHTLREFGLSHPNDKRFRTLLETYVETFEKAKSRVEEKLAAQFPSVMPPTLWETISRASFWWAVALEARKYRKADPQRADLIYRAGLERFPGNALLLDSYATFLLEVRKDGDAAEEHYKKALELAPEDAGILSHYAELLTARGEWPAAEEYHRRSLEIAPNRAESLARYASFLTVRGDYDRAEEHYVRALEIAPDKASIVGEYAKFLACVRQNYHEAERCYKRALEMTPDDALILSSYGAFLAEALQDHAAAVECYEKAVVIEPDNAHILSDYAAMLARAGEDRDKVEALYRRAEAAAPNDAYVLARCAGFLLAGGNEDGYTLLERSMAAPDAARQGQSCLLASLLYLYAHAESAQLQEYALNRIRTLLNEGVRSPGWDFAENVKRAAISGHPEAEFLEKLADVVVGQVDLAALSQFDAWKKETPSV